MRDLKNLAWAAILGAALGGGSIKGLDYFEGWNSPANADIVTKRDIQTLMEHSSPWVYDKPVFEARVSRVERDSQDFQAAIKTMQKDVRRIAMKLGVEVDQ